MIRSHTAQPATIRTAIERVQEDLRRTRLEKREIINIAGGHPRSVREYDEDCHKRLSKLRELLFKVSK